MQFWPPLFIDHVQRTTQIITIPWILLEAIVWFVRYKALKLHFLLPAILLPVSGRGHVWCHRRKAGMADSVLHNTQKESHDILPYQYEPVLSDEVSDISENDTSDTESDDSIGRLINTAWLVKQCHWYVVYLHCTCRCQCTHCVIQPTALDCVCCREIPEIVSKLAEVTTVNIHCITEHPGFRPVCLDVWVLQAAYFEYQQHFGVYPAQQNE